MPGRQVEGKEYRAITADKIYRLLAVSIIWLIGLASMARFGIVGATMDDASFMKVFPLVFGGVMTLAMLVFMTVVFLVRRRP